MTLDDYKAIKAIRNKDAATGGLFIGLALFATVILNYILPYTETIVTITGIVNFAAMSGLLYYFTMQYGKKRGDFGMDYSTAYGFTILTMVFAGVIYGSLYFVQTSIVDPEFYTELQKTMITENTTYTNEYKDLALKTISSGIMSNPAVVIVSTILSTLLYGALLGLVIAALAKRPPKLQ